MLLKELIKKQRSFPLLEDKKMIMRLLKKTNLFSFFKTGFLNCFHTNQTLFQKERKLSENKKHPFYLLIVEFIEKALQYQRDYLTWYTHALWFNKNSEIIFECFDDKDKDKYYNENNKEISDKNDEENEKNISNLGIEILKLKRKDLSRFILWVKPYKQLKFFSLKKHLIFFIGHY